MGIGRWMGLGVLLGAPACDGREPIDTLPFPTETDFTSDPTGTNTSGPGPGAGGAGHVTVDGVRCVVDDGDLVGFCGEAATSFFTDGRNPDCNGDQGATAWLEPDALVWDGELTLNQESNNPAPGEGAVWVDQADAAWDSTSGRASVRQLTGPRGEALVEVSFTAETVDFLTREEPGPSVSGVLLCERP